MKNNAPQFSAIVEKSALVSILARIMAIVEKRNTVPILKFVKIESFDNSLKFTATDLDIEISDVIELPDEIAAHGAFCASADILYDIARKVPNGSQVSLEVDDKDRLSIKAGRSKFNIPTLEHLDFPHMTNVELEEHIEISCDDLALILDKTKLFMATDDVRYYLGGVYLHRRDDKFKFVATDGHRLAYYEMPATSDALKEYGIIIPRKTINEMRRLIGTFPSDEGIRIGISQQKVQFAIKDMVLTSKLIDGSFPDYDRVIPKDHEAILKARVMDLKGGIDRISVLTNDKARSLRFEAGADCLKVSSVNSDNGSGYEDIPAEYSGDDLTIGFNSKYTQEALGLVDSQDVQIYLGGSSSPALIRSPENDNFLFVIMPLRV